MAKPKHINAFDVLNYEDLVNKIAANTGYFKKDVKTILNEFKRVVLDEVAHGNAVRWTQFGTFVPVIRSTRVKQADGSYKYKYSKSLIGFAFYPSTSCSNLKALADVDELLAQGDYDGRRHVYSL